MIKAIDTHYRGFKFRSRLEARWAVFFDAMRHDWTYEPEGFELPSGRYLPDFLMTAFDVYVEIKPKPPTDKERQFGIEMAEAGKRFLMFYGDDPADLFSHWTFPPKERELSNPKAWNWGMAECPGMLCSNRHMDAKLALFISTLCRFPQVTLNACQAARSARFEFGAQG